MIKIVLAMSPNTHVVSTTAFLKAILRDALLFASNFYTTVDPLGAGIEYRPRVCHSCATTPTQISVPPLLVGAGQQGGRKRSGDDQGRPKSCSPAPRSPDFAPRTGKKDLS